jgi:hypothetical protein
LHRQAVLDSRVLLFADFHLIPNLYQLDGNSVNTP